VVDCRKTEDRLRKSGKLRILKIPIRKSGRMVEIGNISLESGKLTGMNHYYLEKASFLTRYVTGYVCLLLYCKS
jgi:hypothetical protein